MAIGAMLLVITFITIRMIPSAIPVDVFNHQLMIVVGLAFIAMFFSFFLIISSMKRPHRRDILLPE